MRDASKTRDVSVTVTHLVCSHRKTMQKKCIGVEKQVLCEWPLRVLKSPFSTNRVTMPKLQLFHHSHHRKDSSEPDKRALQQSQQPAGLELGTANVRGHGARK